MTPNVIKFFLEDEPDGRYSVGEICNFVFDRYALARYFIQDKPGPFALIGIDELTSLLPNGSRKFLLFESLEALDDYLRGIDGEADIVRLVRSPSS